MTIALVIAAACIAGGASAAPIRTGFLDEQSLFSGSGGNLVMQRGSGAGASLLRFMVYWRYVASGPRPANPANPADPAYDWSGVDREVLYAQAHGLQPIIDIVRAPNWAEGPGDGEPGAVRPSATELGLFAKAAAIRYSGTFKANGTVLPRVRFWQVWNEPNGNYFLTPQYTTDHRSLAPLMYRKLVNAMATSVHGVHHDNIVIAGGTLPWGHWQSHSPFQFARKVLCLSSTKPYHSVCRSKTQFDVWGTNPYTYGGPNTHAKHSGDIQVADLPKLHSLITAATNLKKVVNYSGDARRSVGFWSTEFSWDSDLPDPDAVPQSLHLRWTSEAIYRMWKAGVGTVIWFTVRDRPFPASFWQSGFYFCGAVSTSDDSTCAANVPSDVAKPSLEAFRFPFVAYARRGAVGVWGRTPPGTTGAVTIERSTSSAGPFTAVGTVTPRGGIFMWGHSTSWTKGYYRARLASGEASVAFSLTRPADIILHPFGCGGGVPC